MKKTKLIWGFYLILISIFIVLNEIHTFDNIPVLKLLVPLILLPMLIDGIMKRGFLRILAPITVTVLIFSNELCIPEDFSLWILVLAALLLGVGLDLVFPKKKKIIFQNNNANISEDMNRLIIKSKSGSVVKYIDADNFTSADIDASGSGIKLYFDKAIINPHGAVVNLNLTCTRLELFIPRTWQVTDNFENILSSMSISGNDKRAISDTMISLQGKIKFSRIKIIYI